VGGAPKYNITSLGAGLTSVLQPQVAVLRCWGGAVLGFFSALAGSLRLPAPLINGAYIDNPLY
jgi:hypothetical protein